MIISTQAALKNPDITAGSDKFGIEPPNCERPHLCI